MAISHAGHDHPSTPAARAACRKQMANGDTPLTGNPVPAGGVAGRMAAVFTPAKIKMTGATARKLARHAAKADRIQPRRAGARVAASSSTCVQAALHTGTGRCACGWHTDNHCYADCASHAA